MSNEVTASKPGGAPVVDQDALKVAEAYLGKVERVALIDMLPELPSQQERLQLSQASSAILARTRITVGYGAATKDRAARALVDLLAGYPNLRVDAMETVNAYMAALDKLPLFAVMEAIGEVSRSGLRAREAGINSAFAPTAPQLVGLAELIAAPFHEARAKMDRIVSVNRVLPPVISQEQRDDMKRRMEGLARSLRASMPDESVKAARKAEIAARARDDAAHFTLQEYHRWGLDPYYSKSGELVSLSVLLRLGWTVESVDGGNVLVKPY